MAGVLTSIFCVILIAKSMDEILDLSITNYDQQWRMVPPSGQHRNNQARASPSESTRSNSIYSEIEKNNGQENTVL